jgi:hypothetical protein
MKSNTLISCAVAAAIAAAAGAAHATAITSYKANQTAGLNVNVYISGSTAVANTLNNVIQNTTTLEICGSPVNEYSATHLVIGPNGTIASATETMWYCPAGAKSGVSTNLFLAIFKENTAGSINGAQPLIAVAKGQSSNLTFLNPEGTDVQAGTCAGASDSSCTAGDFQNNVVPTGGVADVEASLLRTIPGGGKLSTSDISTYLTGSPGLDIVWGLGVTKNLYYALQSAEGLTSKCPGGNLDSPTCAPSLSKPQVASILAGDIYSWSQIGLNNTSDNNVYICRRDVGSGTEASFEAYFLGARCSSSSESMQAQSPPPTGQVVEQASTGTILNCMEGFDLGNVSVSPYNGDFLTTYTPFTPAGNQWAVGILSTELTTTQIDAADTSSDPQTPGTGTVRMVAIDGVLPSLENVVNGYDPYWGTDSWYTVKSGDNVPSGFPLAVFKAIQGVIGHPTPTEAADANYVNVWGDGGDLAPAGLFLASFPYTSSEYPVSATTVEGNPVNQFTKASSGSVDNCDTPVLDSSDDGNAVSEPDTSLGTGNVNQSP